MKTLIVLTVIVAIATVVYMMAFKKRTIKKINELNTSLTPSEQYRQTSAMLTTGDWKQKFVTVGLEHHWLKFEPLLRHEITIIPEESDESEINVGQSKIGGQPDLPQNQTWFKEDNGKSLSFLAQINLNETNQFDSANQLPSSGLIYFFYSAEQEAWGFDPKDKDKFKVFYFDGDITDIRRRDFPRDLPEHSRFKACKMSFANSVSAPNWESEAMNGILSDEEQDAYIDLTVDGEITKLLGHSDNIQGTMEEECQLVTNGLYCGDPSGYNDPRAEELKKGADKWILLFQIDSIDKAGMMWGDVGRVYFWIKREDLEKRDFGKCWFVLQCS
jgi:uncharacterized protein YwqG